MIEFTRWRYWWGTDSTSETYTAKTRKVKIICKKSCILLVHLHITIFVLPVLSVADKPDTDSWDIDWFLCWQYSLHNHCWQLHGNLMLYQFCFHHKAWFIPLNTKSRLLYLTLILLTWTIWRASTNASKWRMGFNSAFKRLKTQFVPRSKHFSSRL